MSRRNPKGNNKFQFVATILIAAIATIWLGIIGNFVFQQMAPVNQVPEIPKTSPKPKPSQAPSISVTPIPTPTPSPSPSAIPSPSPSFQLPDNPPVIAPSPPVQPVGGAPPTGWTGGEGAMTGGLSGNWKDGLGDGIAEGLGLGVGVGIGVTEMEGA